MARQVNFYASKFANVVILIFALLFVVNFYSTFKEESKMLKESNKNLSVVPIQNEVNLQDRNCSSFMFLNVSFAVVLAMLWNAKQTMKIGTI